MWDLSSFNITGELKLDGTRFVGYNKGIHTLKRESR